MSYSAPGLESGKSLSKDFMERVTELSQLLRERDGSFCFAESCTGGRASAWVAAQAGVSDVYMGSVVAYANSVKEKVLGVRSETLRQLGAVSTRVAEEMAQGAKRQLQAQWAASVTGVAGPGGGSQFKPVGTVCFGVSGPGVEWSTMLRFDGNRDEIQTQSALTLIRILIAAVSGGVEKLNDEFGPRTGL